MDRNNTILLCAGGTGGHLFPAQALAQVLNARGWDVQLATDERAARYSDGFPASATHIVNSATFGSRNPVQLIRAAWKLFSGVIQAKALLRKIKPKVVVGFGGYPSVPPLWAASSYKIPTILHEQNAVMGRANRALANSASAIVMGFDAADSKPDAKSFVLGNPVRDMVMRASEKPYGVRSAKGRFHLLVFGGSQGAHYFSQVVPEALALLKPEIRNRISLVQQSRVEDEATLIAKLDELGIDHEVAPFFPGMAERIANAHLIMARAGASTISELAMIGRPSILVPYPFALDHDQAMNAAELEKSTGCKVIKQAQLDASQLAEELTSAINSPATLEQMAKAAKRTAKPNASSDLANLIEHIADGKAASKFTS